MKILLVEDDVTVSRVLFRSLTGAGHEVTAVVSGTAAVAYLADGFRPDAVVTDLGLPGLPGEQVARSARAHACPFVVLISGDALRLEQARPLGHDAMLKPFRPEELLALLSQPPPGA